MDAAVAEVLLSPFVLALLGLCIGSFLNVVIHRLPLMLERGWKHESAELLGVSVDEAPSRSPCRRRARAARRAGTRSPGTRTSRCSAGCGCAAAARRARPASPLRYPLDRDPDRRPVRARRLALRRRSRWRCCGARSRGAGGAGRHRLGHHAAARQPDAAAALGRPGGERARLDHAADRRGLGRGRRLPVPVVASTGCSS